MSSYTIQQMQSSRLLDLLSSVACASLCAEQLFAVLVAVPVCSMLSALVLLSPFCVCAT